MGFMARLLVVSWVLKDTGQRYFFKSAFRHLNIFFKSSAGYHKYAYDS